jgi:manganese-dependent inorganic pyrophosphatase
MDSIASALGYAWLLNQVHHGGYTPARPGEVNAQTAFALQRFEVEAPQTVIDVRPRVADIVEPVPPLEGEPTVRQASAHFAATRRSVPLLDADGRPRGLLSAPGLFGHLAGPLLAHETGSLGEVLAQPAAALLDGETILLHESDYLNEAVQRVRYVEPDDFLVVDAAGRYRGLCLASAMLEPPRQRLVLVDHNELGQAVTGAEEADIVEVLDHHRVDTVETVLPIRFQVEPVGSCATLVLEEARTRQLSFPPALAGLLLCGVLSDTLVLQSPTTTPRDHAAALTLAQLAGLPGDSAEAIRMLGRDLLAAGAGLGTRSAEEILQADLKFYTPDDLTLAIAQVEVTGFEATEARLPELLAALRALVEARNLALALLMVTDILRGDSRLVAAGDPVLVERLPFAHLAGGLLDAPGVVSRKKQLVPAVLASIR